MLNYIWLSLLVIGILVAIGNDWHDLSSNKYHNGEEATVFLSQAYPNNGFTEHLSPGRTYDVAVLVEKTGLAAAGDSSAGRYFHEKGRFTPASDSAGVLEFVLDAETPPRWKEQAAALKKETVSGSFRRKVTDEGTIVGYFTPEPVKYTHLNAVTNDGFIKYAKTAVELAVGLIGIMALWLGVMKIAEQSGLVGKLASLLRPVTTRLFPDVPPDHPAMGAMIMNISANMLGLSNAATPLGLKAMEELNTLNTKAGTATDAMCTFLVINTSNVQIIPATVIALRAASGSANPTEILGPVIFATAVAMVVGVTTVKLLAKLPFYRRQLAPEAAR